MIPLVRYSLIILLMAAHPVLSLADSKTAPGRDSYSFLTFELEYFGYSESLDKYDISTDYSARNVSLQTGGYFKATDTVGFYLTASSSVLWNTETEEWSGGGAVLQTNDMIATASNTRLLVAYQLTPKQAILFGGGLSNVEYDRYNFQVTPAGEAMGVGVINGAVSELQFSLVASLGYEYNTLFISDHGRTFAYQAQFVVGVPLYYLVTNSSVPEHDKLSDSFNGYDAFTRLTAGYYLSEQLMLAVTLEASYQQRNEVGDIGVTVPETRITQIKPGISLFWSF
jgi:hypothetical protein